MSPVVVVVPIRAESTLNRREHWAARARRVKAERTAVGWALRPHRPPLLPVLVILTRIAPRELDSDNLAAALKGTRDQVAAWLGLDDDRDGRDVAWLVRQRRARPREYAVEVLARTLTVGEARGLLLVSDDLGGVA